MSATGKFPCPLCSVLFNIRKAQNFRYQLYHDAELAIRQNNYRKVRNLILLQKYNKKIFIKEKILSPD
jgi:hypothetical protein